MHQKTRITRLVLNAARLAKRGAGVVRRPRWHASRWALLFVPLTLSAHRLDECLQSAFVSVAPDGLVLELALTPRVEVAPEIIALIDSNDDGAISPEEGRNYAESVGLQLELAIDGRSSALLLGEFHFPSTADMARGLGTISLQWSATWPPLPPGPHRLRFQNNHLPRLSAYLANTLVPTTSLVTVGRQKRDLNQKSLETDFTVARPSLPNRDALSGHRFVPAWRWWFLLVSVAGAAGAVFRRRSRR